MTANGRPNLGGLFTGSTPPDRASSIADALDGSGAGNRARSRPESARSTPRPAEPDETPGSADARSPSETDANPRRTPRTRSGPFQLVADHPVVDRPVADRSVAGGQGADQQEIDQPSADHWPGIQWLDPVRALGVYFDLLQGLFDAHRKVTMSIAAAVTAPVRRAGVWR